MASVIRPVHARRVGLALVAGAALVATVPVSPAVADGHVEVVAGGLNSPRHLSFAPNGDLYIAESGAPTEDVGPCVDHPEFGEVCLAFTSSVSMLSRHGVQSRPVTGLPSLVNPEESVGAFDVLVHGSTLTVAMGLGGTPEYRAEFGADAAPLAPSSTSSGRVRTPPSRYAPTSPPTRRRTTRTGRAWTATPSTSRSTVVTSSPPTPAPTLSSTSARRAA